MPLHRHVRLNSVDVHIAEQGEGPLVLLLHGFPEAWYSWRHQIDAIAAAGYRVVAPDQRGYGTTDRPDSVDQYSIFHLVGDVVALTASSARNRPSSSSVSARASTRTTSRTRELRMPTWAGTSRPPCA
ncbi:alpha/beta fold hydrolase [Streptomyces sp. NPDC002589]|uniref:alpha/beta fold hydrolase n=1 Tax=Streptomyces sp. NPDC002589 TaxID=3154420 RepID=UPI0033212A6C